MSFTLQLGQKAPEFNLISTSKEKVSISSFDSKFLVIFFTCNHCPYVIASIDRMNNMAEYCKVNAIGFVGINSKVKKQGKKQQNKKIQFFLLYFWCCFVTIEHLIGATEL